MDFWDTQSRVCEGFESGDGVFVLECEVAGVVVDPDAFVVQQQIADLKGGVVKRHALH